MRSIIFILGAITLVSCSKQQHSDVVAKTFYHKYGFEVAESEWQMRHKNGKVVTELESGITLTETFENGVLNGETTKTFPHSTTIQKKLVYDDGAILKEILYDKEGNPIWQKDFEFEGQIIKTSWNTAGTPLSVEEFKDDKLMEAKYFTSEHEEEASVNNGFGKKIKRNRSGLLLYQEVIEDGIMTKRITYHPNGKIHSESSYKDLQLHGPQKTYSPKDELLSLTHWNEGILDGEKIFFHKGKKSQVISYLNGKKHGLEIHYNKGEPKAEIQWKHGVRHGSAKFFKDNHTSIKWYFEDQEVTRNQYENLNQKDQVMSELTSIF